MNAATLQAKLTADLEAAVTEYERLLASGFPIAEARDRVAVEENPDALYVAGWCGGGFVARAWIPPEPDNSNLWQLVEAEIPMQYVRVLRAELGAAKTVPAGDGLW